jgi:uncharacterized membrane protein YeaQ/YmgE (transglycosylase-associated protein family)
MALLVLTFMGGLLGWIATIIARIEDRSGILVHVGIGIASSLIAGLIANSGGFIGGLSVLACVIAMASASASLTGVIYLRRMKASD